MATRPTTPSTASHNPMASPVHAGGPGKRARIGTVVAFCFAAGFIASIALAMAPFVPAQVPRAAGALLCGYAVGWAMLAVLSTLFTDQPQRWAAVPAVFMGAGGLLLLGFGAGAEAWLDWVWPPALLALVVWMGVQSRRHLRGRTGPLLVRTVLVLLAAAAVGGAYHVLGAAADDRALPTPGQLVDVSGHRMHLRCTGSGTPTVLLQPGAGETSATMGWIAPAVARTTRVCAYDRPGRGWSEAADAPQAGTALATDLHALLVRAHVPGPYVVAGHSFGGLYTLAFAARYPDEVAGMVLLDSTAPKPATTPASSKVPGSYDALSHASALVGTVALAGVTRLYAHVEGGDLPARSRDEVRASIARTDTLKSTVDEYVQADTAMADAAQLTTLGNKPLVVLTAGKGSAPDWFTKQDRLAALSTNTTHHVIAGAVHEDLVAKQSVAAQSAQAIIAVVDAARTGAPLAR